MIRPTRANREWLAAWSDLLFPLIATALATFITCWAIIPGIVAFFTRIPA